jgi:stage III sporulation protein SpoIIIAA
MAPFLLQSREIKSLLIIGRPGVGKTTFLRELACSLSINKSLTVVVVDKTCEIAGDDLQPHHAIGSARWMPVGRPGLQAQVLTLHLKYKHTVMQSHATGNTLSAKCIWMQVPALPARYTATSPCSMITHLPYPTCKLSVRA